MDTTEQNQIILSPDNIPVLSKQNASTFHHLVKQKIFETGNGLFEYIETVKFMAAVNDQIFGNSSSKVPVDKEFIDHVREQVKLRGEKEKLTTPRGVKFENAETGTSYDFTNCGDPILTELETQVAEITEKLKQRKEFLKTVDGKGLQFLHGDELVTVYPPTKTSKSSFKVSLPKG